MLADGAGVDEDQVGLRRIVGRGIAAQLADAEQLFAVRLVLLAAEGLDPDPAAARGLQTGGDGLLPLDFLRRHHSLFVHSKYRSRM